MEVPLVLQFSIALFTGMVASTFIPPIRRSIPRIVEVAMWVGLVTVCLLGIMSVSDRHARELTTSVAWAAEQLINTLIGMAGAGLGAWISDHRFAIAAVVIVVAALDLMALALIRSVRAAQRAQPRIRLREWMELPLPAMQPAPAPTSSVDLFTHRVAAGVTFISAMVLKAALDLAIWARDVALPREASRLARAAAHGRVRSKAGLEAMRETTAQIQFAARAWYTAAGAPVVSGLAARATQAVRSAAASPGEGQSDELAASRVVDIQALLSAQSIGWYGPLIPAHILPPPGEEDVAESRSDRLAS